MFSLSPKECNNNNNKCRASTTELQINNYKPQDTFFIPLTSMIKLYIKGTWNPYSLTNESEILFLKKNKTTRGEH